MWGEPPALATAPTVQAGCCQQILHPTAKPLPRSSCISKGSRDVITAQGGGQAPLLLWHGDLSEVGGAGPVAGPPPHRTPIASQPKAAHPVALNSAQGLILCPRRGECPRGTACHSPWGPPGADKAACLRRCCWLWLSAWQGGERPARCRAAMGWMQGCRKLRHPLGEPGRDGDAMHWCYGVSPRAAGCHHSSEGRAACT